MKRASRFSLSPSWKVLLADMQIDVELVLAYAKMPADLFQRENASLSPLEYFRLWQGMEKACGNREFALLLAKHLSVEAFDPPIFASICSPDLNTALVRLKHYKPLIGPMLLDINKTDYSTRLTVNCYAHEGNLPSSLALSEVVFFTQLARLATRQKITPLKVCIPELPANPQPYQDYFGCKVSQAEQVSMSFSAEDACKPFLTSNAIMWEFFEANLNKKLADLDSTASAVERVKAVLLESLPAGDSAIESVAEKLAMSKRTLQRKLTAEAETYQSVLQSVRAELAEHYLEKSRMSLAEISFLLGFQETNSFIRAFTHWRGMPPGNFRDTVCQ